MQYDYVIGIEGGGSTCRIVLGRADGQIVDKATLARPASLATDPAETTAATLKGVIDNMLHKHSLSPAQTHIALCLPGVSHTDKLDTLKTVLSVYYKREIPVTSDAMAALLSARKGLVEGTAILIAGTGSILLGYNNGKFYRSGGKGYPNDMYSGAGLCRACLIDYMAFRQKASPADRMRLAHLPFASSLDSFLKQHRVQDRYDLDRLGPKVIASLFPKIYAHATTIPRPLPLIKRHVDAHIRQCAHDIEAYCAKTGIRDIALLGGVARQIAGAVRDQLSPGIKMTVLGSDALEGALAYALATRSNPAFLENVEMVAIDKVPEPQKPAPRR